MSLLSEVDKYERLQIADALIPCSFKDGETIVKQGDEGEEFFIIVDGEVIVTQKNDKGEEGEVGQLGRADYFGEIALLKDNKRHATVTAKGDVKCVKLDRDRFERVLGPVEDILRRSVTMRERRVCVHLSVWLCMCVGVCSPVAPHTLSLFGFLLVLDTCVRSPPPPLSLSLSLALSLSLSVSVLGL